MLSTKLHIPLQKLSTLPTRSGPLHLIAPAVRKRAIAAAHIGWLVATCGVHGIVYVYVCLYVYVCICMYVYMWECMFVCLCDIYIYICICIRMHVCVYHSFRKLVVHWFASRGYPLNWLWLGRSPTSKIYVWERNCLFTVL